MKKIMIFTLLICMQEGIAQSFIDMESKWIETEETAAPLPFMNSGRFFRISEVVGDTMINGLFYHQLITHTDEYELSAQGDTVDVFSYFNPWFLRENANRFYKLRPGDAGEKLLFDFNLSLGDTAYVNESYAGIWVVAGLYETEVNGRMVPSCRLVNEGEPDTLLVYQGVGSSTGFYDGIKPRCCEGEPVASSSLDCFGNMDGIHAFNEWADYCEAEIVSAKVRSRTEGLFSLSPNPASEVVYLQFGTMPGPPAEVRIYDRLGRVVFAQSIKEAGQYRRLEVPVAGWPPGVYVAEVRSAGQLSVEKFVVGTG